MSWKTSLIISGWVWVWKSSWCHLRKCSSSTKFTISISWFPVCAPLIPCHYHWNGWWPWLRQQKRGKCAVLKNYQHDKLKGSERRPLIFIFRLNIALHDSYQADEIVMEIEEWTQAIPGDYVKSFSRV